MVCGHIHEAAGEGWIGQTLVKNVAQRVERLEVAQRVERLDRERLACERKETLQLVWSDEFNVDGRTFYPGQARFVVAALPSNNVCLGDDPYWEAVDLHYWQTSDKE